MSRNKYGLPFVFDYVRGIDKRRLNNLKKMVDTCPESFKPMWVDKLEKFKKIVHDRKEKYLN